MEHDEFNTSQRVPGELNYWGHDGTDLEFSFDDVLKGIKSLDGEDRCGLHFRRGTVCEDEHADGVIVSNWKDKHVQPITLTGDTFCVGGGAPDSYICHVYTPTGPVWLTNPHGNSDELHEIRYDSGCDIDLGVFPGNFVLTHDIVVEAARCFFLTSELTDKFRWISRDDMGFDPWYRD